ncbi:radical SAM protein [Elizabethkingia sp. HX WHF]|uniref:radical SAM/SPASM domain-containing protein n=1 Tax=Elizabethkingia TaxID=308865 RepID=UPI00099ADFA9|nr:MULTISPECIES: radical SAM protein [Elizabethkingia]ATL43494.1 radical SAM protein [Elizabethkingia miricola]MCL1638416.1 radical SAM protein [Elizabethkingia bruuniana]MDX8564556.1 radical SAM protein [Elizabethkingia sp. HX WHF]OPC26337.1 hypothetical protein BAY00_03265 [Elizabethkingia bruuniana]
MKTSIYNNFITYDNKNVCYNLLNDKFVILEDDLKELLLAANRENNIDELKEIHPDFYEFLAEEGYIVDEEKDEFQEVVSVSKEVDDNEKQYLLFINPTMNCNFKCWYCYETHIKDSKMDNVNIEKTIQFIENIISQNNKIEDFAISWFGGEPLLYFDKVVVPILEGAKKITESSGINLITGFTTNGLLFDQKKIDFLKKYTLQEIQITLDGYKDNHDKIRYISETKGSFDKIIKNIILLADNQINVVVRVNCTEQNINDIDKIMSLFQKVPQSIKKYLKFTFHKVWQLESSLEYDVRHYIDKYKNSDFYVDGAVFDSVRGSCYADKYNQAFINYNGDVFKCSARDFESKSKLGQLEQNGTITWNEKKFIRQNAKFQNIPCQTCSILPVCGGGCSQVAYENLGKDYCVNDFDENKKKEIVKRVFEQKIIFNV